MNKNEPNPYADIIDLPHHVSKRHPQMPMEKRAAQFSPFAAVASHDKAIRETARVTEKQVELSEDEIAVIDEKLQWIRDHIKELPEVTVTYFQPDEKKDGGAYVTATGSAKKVVNEKRIPKPKDAQEQFDLFTDYEAVQEQREEAEKEERKEKSLQQAMIAIKHKFGKNAILKGANLQKGAMTMERNQQLGGHKA